VDQERLLALAAAVRGENPLTALEATAGMRAELERWEAVLVRRARNNGATWAQIAAVLGISKQAVHKKYGGRGLFGSHP
jgi:hypothetical protein